VDRVAARSGSGIQAADAAGLWAWRHARHGARRSIMRGLASSSVERAVMDRLVFWLSRARPAPPRGPMLLGNCAWCASPWRRNSPIYRSGERVAPVSSRRFYFGGLSSGRRAAAEGGGAEWRVSWDVAQRASRTALKSRKLLLASARAASFAAVVSCGGWSMAQWRGRNGQEPRAPEACPPLCQRRVR
jgi:hypothetical protein